MNRTHDAFSLYFYTVYSRFTSPELDGHAGSFSLSFLPACNTSQTQIGRPRNRKLGNSGPRRKREIILVFRYSHPHNQPKILSTVTDFSFGLCV